MYIYICIHAYVYIYMYTCIYIYIQGVSKNARLTTIFSTSKDHFKGDNSATCGCVLVSFLSLSFFSTFSMSPTHAYTCTRAHTYTRAHPTCPNPSKHMHICLRGYARVFVYACLYSHHTCCVLARGASCPFGI